MIEIETYFEFFIILRLYSKNSKYLINISVFFQKNFFINFWETESSAGVVSILV